MSGINAGVQGRVKLSDTFLANNPGVVIDLQRLTPAAAFEQTNLPKMGSNGMFHPRWIKVSSNGGGATDTYGQVEVMGWNDVSFSTEVYTTHEWHPDWINKIRVGANTTARDISIGQ